MDNRLFTAIDSAGIVYTMRITDRGIPYAGFRWRHGLRYGESALTAIIEEDVLRLTAHEVKVDADPAALSNSAKSLPIGNPYVSPDNGQVEIALGLYLCAIESIDSALLPLVNYIDEARRCIEGRSANPNLPHLSSVTPQKGQDIGPLLIGYGHQPTLVNNGAAVEFKLEESLRCRVVVQEGSDPWFVGDACYLPAASISWGQKEWLLLQRLQRWARAGRFVREPSGELRAEVLTPNLGQPRNELIMWTGSQSTALLHVAAKHFNLGGHEIISIGSNRLVSRYEENG